MSDPKPVRGTHDLIGDEARLHRHIEDTARRVASAYGYEEWSTPIFEETRVFARTLGDTSDVVTKEMYSFVDRGGESLTLRPEGTASICRALVSNGLTQTLPRRVFYHGPMFRYERPQKGRFRQFHQIGVEQLGAYAPLSDAETIALADAILRELGLSNAVTLALNTLGDSESRAKWREALVAYFSSRFDALSQESRLRLEKNPLRILDSKNADDRAVCEQAPRLTSFLNASSLRFWDDLRRHLDMFGVRYVENPFIVRGLDYYSHTAFEFVTDRLGAQSTVLAGGRYEGLISEMGGPSTPAFGWAAGCERLALLVDKPSSPPSPIFVLPLSDATVPSAIRVAQNLRGAGRAAELETRGPFKKRMARVLKSEADFMIVVGEDELSRDSVTVRDLKARQQSEIRLDEILDHFQRDA